MLTADSLRVIFWIALPSLVLLLALFQKRGPNYFPVAILTAFAIFSTPGFYIVLLFVFRFNVPAVIEFASTIRAGLILYPVQIFFLVWAIALVVRVNLGKPGMLVDIWGRDRLPTPEEIEHSMTLIKRAENHELITPLTIKWGREDLTIRRAMEMAYQRNIPGEGSGRTGVQLWLIGKMVGRLWRAKRNHHKGHDAGHS